MFTKTWPWLRCPICKNQLTESSGALVCSSCEGHYPIINGMPLCVPDASKHEADMETARLVKPTWYQDEQPPEQSSPWRHHLRKRREYVHSVLRAECNAKRKRFPMLLDLGCGDGNNTLWLQEFASQLCASDYNMVRLARTKHRVPAANCFLGNILQYPVADASMDCVFFNHVLEHIPDDIAALHEVRRVLKPGGLLILGVPNEGCWWWQLAYKRDPESLRTTDHVHFYTSKIITERLAETGFTITSVHHMGWGPPDWSLDGRIRQYKWVDDLFERVGKIFIPGQASSLYVIAHALR